MKTNLSRFRFRFPFVFWESRPVMWCFSLAMGFLLAAGLSAWGGEPAASTEKGQLDTRVRIIHRTDGPTVGMGWAISHNGRYVLFDELLKDGPRDKMASKLVLWDLKESRKVWERAELYPDGVQGMTFSPDDKRAATCGIDKMIRILDVRDGKVIREIISQGRLRDITWLPNGKGLVTGGDKCPLVRWDPDNGARLGQYGDTEYWLRGLAVAANSDRFASAGWDGAIRIWETETGGHTVIPAAGLGRITSIALSPRAEHVLAAYLNNPVVLWNVREGKEIHRFGLEGNPWFTGEIRAVESVSFSKDGWRALFATYHGILFLWDVEEWRRITYARLPPHTEALFIDFCLQETAAVAMARDSRNRFAMLGLWSIPVDEQTTSARPDSTATQPSRVQSRP